MVAAGPSNNWNDPKRRLPPLRSSVHSGPGADAFPLASPPPPPPPTAETLSDRDRDRDPACVVKTRDRARIPPSPAGSPGLAERVSGSGAVVEGGGTGDGSNDADAEVGTNGELGREETAGEEEGGEREVALDEGEVREHAVALGIDPMSEPYLLWIARQSLSTPLPPNWIERRDARGRVYINAVTGIPTREHPAELQYRTMVLVAQAEREQRMEERRGGNTELAASAALEEGRLGVLTDGEGEEDDVDGLDSLAASIDSMTDSARDALLRSASLKGARQRNGGSTDASPTKTRLGACGGRDDDSHGGRSIGDLGESAEGVNPGASEHTSHGVGRMEGGVPGMANLSSSDLRDLVAFMRQQAAARSVGGTRGPGGRAGIRPTSARASSRAGSGTGAAAGKRAQASVKTGQATGGAFGTQKQRPSRYRGATGGDGDGDGPRAFPIDRSVMPSISDGEAFGPDPKPSFPWGSFNASATVASVEVDDVTSECREPSTREDTSGGRPLSGGGSLGGLKERGGLGASARRLPIGSLSPAAGIEGGAGKAAPSPLPPPLATVTAERSYGGCPEDRRLGGLDEGAESTDVAAHVDVDVATADWGRARGAKTTWAGWMGGFNDSGTPLPPPPPTGVIPLARTAEGTRVSSRAASRPASALPRSVPVHHGMDPRRSAPVASGASSSPIDGSGGASGYTTATAASGFATPGGFSISLDVDDAPDFPASGGLSGEGSGGSPGGGAGSHGGGLHTVGESPGEATGLNDSGTPLPPAPLSGIPRPVTRGRKLKKVAEAFRAFQNSQSSQGRALGS